MDSRQWTGRGTPSQRARVSRRPGLNSPNGMITLYTTPLSANGRKVLAASRELGLAPDVRLVNVYRGEGRTSEYLAVNPSGRIPTLVDGDLTLTESNAILLYLAEARGDFRLSSRDPATRARIVSWLFWESAHWQPALAAVLSPFVGHRLVPDAVPAPAGQPDWDDAALKPLLVSLDGHLRARAFLMGDALSVSDFSVAGMATYLRAVEFPFAAYPGFAEWYERIERLESWRGTLVEPWC